MSYPWQNISPKDAFRASQTNLISDVDRKILTQLYQPIIGPQAFSLYLTLLAEIPQESYWSKELLHTELLALSNSGIQEFYQARVKLEGIGLLKTFLVNEPEKQYLYELQQPLSSHAFFSDDLMGLLLYEKVGERKYRELQQRFSRQVRDLKNAENITKSFLDVFSFSESAFTEQARMRQNDNTLLGDNTASLPVIENDGFDFSFFRQLLNKQFVKRESITKELEHTITILYTLYGCDELQMAQFILEAADIESGKVDGETLKNIVSAAYEQRHSNRLEVKDKVTQSIQLAKDTEKGREQKLIQARFSSEEISFIKACEQLTPHQFLSSIKKQKGGIVTASETQLLRTLMEKADFKPGVLNVLTHYVLVILNNPHLSKAYVEAIANDWLQDGVDSPEKALAKAKQFAGELKAKAEKRAASRTTAKNYGKTVARKKENLPDWAKDEQKVVGEKPLTPEAQQKLNERIKKLKSSGKAGDE